MGSIGKQCITHRVAVEVSEELQRLLWDILISIIRGRDPRTVDFLQIFELSVIERHGHALQRIVHHQERPFWQGEGVFEVDQPIDATLYGYIDGASITLMFAEDY